MKKLASLLLLLSAIGPGCIDISLTPDDDEGIIDPYLWLRKMEFVQTSDTLTIIQNGNSIQLNMRGTFIEEIVETAVVTGVIGQTSETRRSTVTSAKPLPSSDITWSTSNASVASVVNGLVSGKSGGYADISGSLHGVKSEGITIRVIPLPRLTVDEPLTETVYFLDSGYLKCTVDLNTNFSINGEPASYDEQGIYERYYTNLQQGSNNFDLRAANKDFPEAVATAQKVIRYYSLPSMTGSWVGDVDDTGSSFNMVVSESTDAPGQYVISGTFRLVLFGLVAFNGIGLTGTASPDGSFEASFAFTSGPSISGQGQLKGNFTSEKTLEGSVQYQVSYDSNNVNQTHGFSGTK